MSFFTSSDTEQKRRLALFHAVSLIFKADPNPSMGIQLQQQNFIRTLAMGLSSNPLFIPKAESMPDVEMASILRNCSNFSKRSYAQTLSSAAHTTSESQEVRDALMNIAYECDIPLDYFM